MYVIRENQNDLFQLNSDFLFLKIRLLYPFIIFLFFKKNNKTIF